MSTKIIWKTSFECGLRTNIKYSIQLDRMAADCAVELMKHNVACVSLWPGLFVHTENVKEISAKYGDTIETTIGIKV